MLFGRKTPFSGTPKQEGAGATGRPGLDGAAAAPGQSLYHPGSAGGVQASGGPSSSASHPFSSTSGMSASASHYRASSSDKGPEMNTTSPKAPAIPGAMFKSDTPRRVVDVPGSLQRRPDMGSSAAPAQEIRRLVVGRDISLAGEIGSCDVLVVEGTVEAKLREGHSIEITETGLFRGSVEIDDADIGGRFEGELVVRGRLRIRASGRVDGSVKYGELEVEAGGRVNGSIQYLSANASPAAIAAPIPTAMTSISPPSPPSLMQMSIPSSLDSSDD
jgi:cytoskeletal protein CcmA (bactofilin family)